jgi:hypothetical protein
MQPGPDLCASALTRCSVRAQSCGRRARPCHAGNSTFTQGNFQGPSLLLLVPPEFWLRYSVGPLAMKSCWICLWMLPT